MSHLPSQIEKNHVLLGYLQSTFSYDFFEKLTTAFIKSVVPEFPQSRNKHEQIALTFEVTSRLRALDLHPMNRVMGFGAQYLQKTFTPWVKQHGGWVRVYAPFTFNYNFHKAYCWKVLLQINKFTRNECSLNNYNNVQYTKCVTSYSL